MKKLTFVLIVLLLVLLASCSAEEERTASEMNIAAGGRLELCGDSAVYWQEGTDFLAVIPLVYGEDGTAQPDGEAGGIDLPETPVSAMLLEDGRLYFVGGDNLYSLDKELTEKQPKKHSAKEKQEYLESLPPDTVDLNELYAIPDNNFTHGAATYNRFGNYIYILFPGGYCEIAELDKNMMFVAPFAGIESIYVFKDGVFYEDVNTRVLMYAPHEAVSASAVYQLEDIPE